MTRREFTLGLAAAVIPLRLDAPVARPLRFAVITDIHHGLAPDAMSRMEAFVAAVERRKDLDLVLQMGDFCHAVPESDDFLALWNRIRVPRLHVLGNHDMDRVDKDGAMRFWGMKQRYGAYEFGGYRFIVLDLNHFRKDGKLVPYANGNYFTDNATHNWADSEQLAWLGTELRRGRKPTILISHQPLGFGSPPPPEQVEVLKVVTEAAAANPAGAVAACLFGHLHVDRLEAYEGIPCLCVNSASYFWAGGMYAYTKPLFAFMELTPKGELVVEGIAGEFAKPPPSTSDTVAGRSGSISSRRLKLDAVR